jgi:hypothetical protein
MGDKAGWRQPKREAQSLGQTPKIVACLPSSMEVPA